MKRQIFKRNFVFLALAAVVAATPAWAASSDDRAAIKHGQALYNTDGCSQCHGWAGQGGVAGPTLLTPSSQANYITQLRNPRAVMPPYTAKVLQDQDIADIFAYVQTLPKPPDVKKIKLLQD